MKDSSEATSESPKNILIITCDQFRFPRFSYGPDGGFVQPLKDILGFQGEIGDDHPYARYFPGLLRLRKNAVVLRNHSIGAAACTPSRALIYTGQYAARTGVTQTDGLFKNGDSPNFPWLNAQGIPTLGTWMRHAGYTTHYFGKWHVSNPPNHSLQDYGFDNWEESYPEPHGSQANNLGLYRDFGFTDSACTFLRRMALGLNYNRLLASQSAHNPNAAAPPALRPPWLAVLSLTNPHDIATFPGVIALALPGDSPQGTQRILGPLTVPTQTERSLPPAAGVMTIPLNPLNFPQECAAGNPSQAEDLTDNKPACQRDYAYKMGLALSAKLGYNFASATGNDQLGIDVALQNNIPFDLTSDPDGSVVLFTQLYAWLHTVVDVHISRILDVLEETGQAANTTVIFLADHGEMSGAHGRMIEKWHTAYQEVLHVPVVVVDPDLNPNPTPVQVDKLTSHVDILPTVLGLAGVDAKARETIRQQLLQTRSAPPLPGVDLTPVLKDPLHDPVEPDGGVREAVLFVTADTITAPLDRTDDNPHDVRSLDEYALYQQVVDAANQRHPGLNLSPSAVVQPNHIHCARGQRYKLARYYDPSGRAAQQWELYDLAHDPNELNNLADVNSNPPTPAQTLPGWTDSGTVTDALAEMLPLLESLERRYLGHVGSAP